MIGARLLEIIEDRFGNRNQVKLAKLCLISTSALSGYIKKNKIPNHEFLIQLSGKLDVNINWLLTGKGPKRLSETGGISPPDSKRPDLIERTAKLLASGNQEAIDTLEQDIKHLERTIEKEKKQLEANEAVRKELAELKKQKCQDGKHCPGEQLPGEKAA